MTLTEFLLARIAEDEAVAQQATDRPGYFTIVGWAYYDVESGEYLPYGEDKQGDVGMPARVLAECAAKRGIITHEHLRACDNVPRSGFTDPAVADRIIARADTRALRLLALPYADHPDYREEWRP